MHYWLSPTVGAILARGFDTLWCYIKHTSRPVDKVYCSKTSVITIDLFNFTSDKLYSEADLFFPRQNSHMQSFRKNELILLLLGLNLAWSSKAATIATKRKLVCVFGAGVAGLASVKQVAEHTDEFDVVGFEKSSDAGGLWIYTDSTDVDEHNLPVHSSMYKYLRTNTPKETMAYPDYRNFQGEDRSSVTHETVLSYLRNYTDHFNLRQYIQFDTLVEKVTPIIGDGNWRTINWKIRTRNLNTNETTKTTCDAVMVTNGHYTVPKIPKIPGIETFPGKVIHSHIYRRPEGYAGQTVILLGAGESGLDISIEISNYAKRVYLSHNHDKIPHHLPPNLVQVSGVLSANGNTLTLRDGSNITADAFIFCTGYLFTYPFLDEASGIEIKNNYVVPLYKHLVNIEHPSMCLPGLPKGLIFSIFYLQAKYFVSLLRGKAQLPSRADMLIDSKRDDDFNPWAYFDDLAESGGFKPLPSYYKRGTELWMANSFTDLLHYKDANLRVLDNGEVELILPPGQSNRVVRN